jgi:hypothetical protein
VNALSEEAVLKSILAKSDQLNAVDLVAGPIDVVIESISEGAADQPWIIKIKGYQPYKPCKSMRRVIVACWGTRPAQWVGRSMRLFCDPTAKWAGEEVGGIRISHLSHIDSMKEIQLNESRGKKKKWKIEPLVEDTETRVQKVLAALDAAKSKEAVDKILKNAAKLIEICGEDQKSMIDARAKELGESYEAKS